MLRVDHDGLLVDGGRAAWPRGRIQLCRGQPGSARFLVESTPQRRLMQDVSAVLHWLPGLRIQLESRESSASPTQKRSRRLRWLVWLPIGVLGAGAVLLLLWALVTVPAQLLGIDQARVVQRIQDPAKQMDEVNALRSTLAAVFAGLAVAIGTVVGALNFRETGRQNRAVLELQHRGQVTERFAKAIEQLGSEKLNVRIGAVYALEQIARDSADLYWPIMEVLTAFMREHRPLKVADEVMEWPWLADSDAIMAVLGRRDARRDPADQRLDLFWTDLHEINVYGANLWRSNLRESNLRGAELGSVDLRGARLDGANLRSADLSGANLNEANLTGASLDSTDLREADLRNTVGLTIEQLRSADTFEDAQLPPELAEQMAPRADAGQEAGAGGG